MDIDEFAHAVSTIHGGAPLGDFDLAPNSMRIEGNEEIGRAVAAVPPPLSIAASSSRSAWLNSIRYHTFIVRLPIGGSGVDP